MPAALIRILTLVLATVFLSQGFASSAVAGPRFGGGITNLPGNSWGGIPNLPQTPLAIPDGDVFFDGQLVDGDFVDGFVVGQLMSWQACPEELRMTDYGPGDPIMAPCVFQFTEARNSGKVVTWLMTDEQCSQERRVWCKNGYVVTGRTRTTFHASPAPYTVAFTVELFATLTYPRANGQLLHWNRRLGEMYTELSHNSLYMVAYDASGAEVAWDNRIATLADTMCSASMPLIPAATLAAGTWGMTGTAAVSLAAGAGAITQAFGGAAAGAAVGAYVGASLAFAPALAVGIGVGVVVFVAGAVVHNMVCGEGEAPTGEIEIELPEDLEDIWAFPPDYSAGSLCTWRSKTIVDWVADGDASCPRHRWAFCMGEMVGGLCTGTVGGCQLHENIREEACVIEDAGGGPGGDSDPVLEWASQDGLW